jgi:F0F1-type ATP synthase, subunit b
VSIDWVTVIAQTANFLVLVYLLKRFLYSPVLEAMDQREQRVKDRLEHAQQRENDAEQQAQAHEEAIEELKADREAQMQAAEMRQSKLGNVCLMRHANKSLLGVPSGEKLCSKISNLCNKRCVVSHLPR